MSPAALPSTESPRRPHRHNRLRPFCSPSALGPQLVALFSAPALKGDSTRLGSPCAAPRPSPPARVSSLGSTAKSADAPTLVPSHHSVSRLSLATWVTRTRHSPRPRNQNFPGPGVPGSGSPGVSPAPSPPGWARWPGVETMTARGTPSRFLTSVLHNGLGRYVQQLQRLSFSLSRDAPSSRGAR